MKIMINYDDNDLWCVYSKERIVIGEKYVEVFDGYLKTYKLENAPSDDEELFVGA